MPVLPRTVARAAMLAMALAACNASPASQTSSDNTGDAAIIEKANATVTAAQREAASTPAD